MKVRERDQDLTNGTGGENDKEESNAEANVIVSVGGLARV